MEFSKKLSAVQEQMKTRYDCEALQRSFQIGDRVLVLLQIPGSPLKAKFVVPYEIQAKLGETDYVVNTFNRRRKSRVCHVNMLKAYVARSDVSKMAVAATVVPVNVSLSDYSLESDDSKMRSASFLSARLLNSDTLKNLSTKLSHLLVSAQADLRNLK